MTMHVRNKYTTRQEARLDIFEYIEVFYNKERIHSSIDYMTPTEYRNQYLEAS